MKEPQLAKLNDPDLGIDNPYWQLLKPYVTHSEMERFFTSIIYPEAKDLPGPLVVGERDQDWQLGIAGPLRRSLCQEYAWTITDPWAVQFVVRCAGGRLIDPMAGTGYWGYLLRQLGVDCYLSDLDPPVPETDGNFWHPRTKMFTDVERLDGVESVKQHGRDRTLLLSWPPMSEVGYDILMAYEGNRLIHIGELGGCTGDDNLQAEINTNWTLIEWERPVQASGLHDIISFYARTGSEMPEPRKDDEQENKLKE